MIHKFINYIILSYNKTVNTVLLLCEVICCLKMPSTKYSSNLFQQIPLDIIPKWVFCNQEYSSDISLQKLEYIEVLRKLPIFGVKSALYKNADVELEVNTVNFWKACPESGTYGSKSLQKTPNFIGKFCDNKLCQKKLAKYDTWYCYDGYAYCCSNCRLNFIKNVYIKENLNSGFMLNQCLPEYSLEHTGVDINLEDN